jgi:hypothetical protein
MNAQVCGVRGEGVKTPTAQSSISHHHLQPIPTHAEGASWRPRGCGGERVCRPRV